MNLKKIFATLLELLNKFNNPDKNPPLKPENPSDGEQNMKKLAVCIGINNYPGTSNDLRGCVNDAKDWSSLLNKQYGFDVTLMLDDQATVGNVSKTLKRVISQLKDGDCFVFTFSGHGTSVRDNNSDEEDGKDEAICLYNGLMIDDKLRSVLDSIPNGVKTTFISDSCHSGTVSRAFQFTMTENKVRVRYMPPKKDSEIMELSALPLKTRMFKGAKNVQQEEMNEVLITGCLPHEYSYDAYISGKSQGALSAAAKKIIRDNPETTYNDFYAKLKKELPSSRYPQTPQLEGSSLNRSQRMFS